MQQPAHRRPTVEELQEQEERYRSLFENANDGIFIVSREGRFVAVNQKYVELTGIPKEELVGQTTEILLPGGFAQSLERIERTIREGTLGPYDMEVTTSLGTKVLSLNSFVYHENSTPAGIMCIARDVTGERRRKEQQALYRLAHELARSADIRTMADHLFAQTQSLLGADYGFLLLADAEGSEMRGVAACGVNIEAFRRERIAVREEIAPVSQAFQQRRPVVVTDIAHSPLVSERLREQYSFLGSIWVVPLMNGEEAVGVFAIGYVTHREATAEELRFLQLLGDEAALAIERARLTEELRESEKRYRSLFENANDAIVTFTLEGIVTSVNRGLEVMLGWAREELIGQHFCKFVPLASVAQGEERTRRFLAGERLPSIFEAEMVCKDGRVVPVEVRTRAICDSAGKPIGFQGIYRDTTARKRAEEALRESEARFRTVLSGAPIVLFAVDREGVITLSEGRGLEVLGWEPGEHVGQSIFNVHRDVPQIGENIRRALAGEEFTSTVEVARLVFETRYAPLRDESSVVSGVIGVATDITEHKRMEEALRQAEEKYRSIFENAVEGIFQSSRSGAILAANPALARMLGYDSPEELQAQVTDVGTQVYVNPECRAELMERLRERDVVQGAEFQFYRKDSSTFWGSVSIRAIRDAKGALFYYEGMIEDITQRREVDRLKGEFVSVVSHELRTPLTSIRGSLGLLASGMLGPVSEKGQRMLDIAVQNTDRLVRLINDILDVERIQSGKVSMVKIACMAADLMTQAAEVMQAMAEKAEVTLSVQPVSAQLWVDPDRIIQTLTNLLSNAIKFSPAGTTVWLTAEPQEEQLLVQVSDQGRGIPADKLESIFERFQQVDASDAREKGGTGLGLTICRSIVHQHGGRIWAESTLGEGSTFSFTLPLFKEGQPAVSAASVGPLVTVGDEKGPASVASDGQTRPLQVLVAEDDRDLARVLIAMFERHGAVTYYAQTGAAAIECCSLMLPDLLILDPVMPEQDGFAVVDWLRQHERLRQLPVVVYAAGELTSTEQSRLTLGPTRFLTKSRIAPEQFEQQVLHWLDQLGLTSRREHAEDGHQAPSPS